MVEKSRLSDAIGTTRSFVGLVKDIALYGFLAFVIWVLLAKPAMFSSKLQDIGGALRAAGFTKVSAFGQEFDLNAIEKRVEESNLDQQLAEERLKQANDALARAWQTLEATDGATVGSESARVAEARQSAMTEIRAAQTAIETSISQTDLAQTQLRNALEKTVAAASVEPSPPVAKAAPSEPAPKPSATSPDTASVEASALGPIVVVIGGDRDLEPAQWEVKRVEKAGYAGAAILKRDGWFRTAIPFESRTSAERELAKIRSDIREGSYIRDLTSWCSGGLTLDAGRSFWSCTQ